MELSLIGYNEDNTEVDGNPLRQRRELPRTHAPKLTRRVFMICKPEAKVYHVIDARIRFYKRLLGFKPLAKLVPSA